MTAQIEAADLFAFDNSYARLPDRFFARLPPTPVAAPRLVKLNEALARHLGLDPVQLSSPEGVAILAGNRVPKRASRSPWPMPATSSAISCRSSVTDAPFFWARLSIATACAVTSSSRDRARRLSPGKAMDAPRSGLSCANTSSARRWRRSGSRPPGPSQP